MRGTWGSKDVAADIGDIVRDGAAYEQIIDMYNFYQQLKAEKGKTYRAAKAETDIGLSVAYSAAISAGPLATKAFEDKLRGKGYFIDGKPDGHKRALVKKSALWIRANVMLRAMSVCRDWVFFPAMKN